jgi:hypothetical protein
LCLAISTASVTTVDTFLEDRLSHYHLPKSTGGNCLGCVAEMSLCRDHTEGSIFFDNPKFCN